MCLDIFSDLLPLIPSPSPSQSSKLHHSNTFLPQSSHLLHLNLSPLWICRCQPPFSICSLLSEPQFPCLATLSLPFCPMPKQTPFQEIGLPLSPTSRRRMMTPCAPLVSLMTQNKSSGIARCFTSLCLHPSHPLLHVYPCPLSTTAPPVLSLLTHLPPSLRRYLSRQTGKTEQALLRRSGLVLWLLLCPPPCLLPLPLPHPIPLSTARSVAAQGISSWDVQLCTLERERMSQCETFSGTMITIISWLFSFVCRWSK